MQINIGDLRVTNKEISSCTSEPFPFFCWDNYLPEDIYVELDRSWPNNEFYNSPIYGGKRAFQKRETEKVKKFLDKNDAWRSLIESLETQEFINDIQKFVKPLQKIYRPFVAKRKWKIVNNDNFSIRNLFNLEVDVDWELSKYEKNNFLDPHTDRLTKYVSLL